ncbi:PTS sugar transporter subunit IIA [Sporolactobacillus sp. THM19-2]|jgi:PTS system mannose-specific IIA component|uniref:PTS sugar transporter subunit IIA n=1 Tax=Sporolactobacillus sp. THM19-2 TaxID=2511171 RepID=UPI0010207867|nr:mannose/fructose/sorbose PTS transporter subunit IIA [Sporolactobacillus sp. THM19-2]RYL94488.1 PTS mannose transporter subunit IID [Sporolactobacillus sp. THM19-2]
MIALIIATHGAFSREIVKSAEMIFGKQENVATVTFSPGEGPDDLKRKYEDALHGLDIRDGLLFMVDLFGGSPFNAASNFAAGKENMDVITGLSLPMLIECFSKRDSLNLEALVDEMSQTAVEGVKSLNKTLGEAENDSGEDDF